MPVEIYIYMRYVYEVGTFARDVGLGNVGSACHSGDDGVPDHTATISARVRQGGFEPVARPG